MSNDVECPQHQSRATIHDARNYVLERWGYIILDPDGQPTPPDPPDTISYWAKRGPKPKMWQLRAFAEIDDLVREEAMQLADAIRDIRLKYENLGHAHEFDAFEAMYHKFKSDDELRKRKAVLAAAIVDGNVDEAAEQAFRLSMITNIESIFRKKIT